MLLVIKHRTRRLDCRTDYRRQLGAGLLQFQRPVGDTRDVEQIIEQETHVLDLTLDDLIGALPLFRRPARLLGRGQRVAYRREGIAQFRRQQRQKRVLASLGLAQGFLAEPEALLKLLASDEISGVSEVERQASQLLVGGTGRRM